MKVIWVNDVDVQLSIAWKRHTKKINNGIVEANYTAASAYALKKGGTVMDDAVEIVKRMR